MSWNNISDGERLRLWKNLRDNIKSLPLDEQLTEIVSFCDTMPRGSRTLDYYSPDDWPSPWEILFHGSFCISSVSLLMFYTLTLFPNEKKLDLILVEDASAGIHLLLVVNDQFVLNYHYNTISKLDEIGPEFIILKQYKQSEVKPVK